MTRCPFAKANAGTIVSSNCDREECEWWIKEEEKSGRCSIRVLGSAMDFYVEYKT